MVGVAEEGEADNLVSFSMLARWCCTLSRHYTPLHNKLAQVKLDALYPS